MNYARYIIKQIRSDANAGNAKIGWAPVNAFFGSLLAMPVDWLKNAFIFHPNVKVDVSPTDFGLPYEEVWFGGTDGRLLHGWYVPSLRKETAITDPLFIWFHGNAGNVGHRLAHLRLLREQVGGSHFVFDYQGFGKSRGKPSATGILDDGRAAIACAQQHGWMGERPTIYLGESLGAAVAVTLALETPRVILFFLPRFSLCELWVRSGYHLSLFL